MMGMTILGVSLALFVLAFVTRRRFGVLGLGLAAGVLLNIQFHPRLEPLLSPLSYDGQVFSAGTVATVLLVLAPAVLLLIGGPRYRTGRAALLGGLGFLIMTYALLLEPLSRDSFWIAETLRPAVEFLGEWQGMVVAAGVVAAVIDMFLARSHGPSLRRRRH